MIDLKLTWNLVRAIPSDGHLVIVGDPAQLPSVGAGRVLADLLHSGLVPSCELKHIFRQQERGAIIEAAHDIRSGKVPEPAAVNKKNPSTSEPDLVFWDAADDEV